MQKFLKSAAPFILGAAAVGVTAKVAYDKNPEFKKTADTMGNAAKKTGAILGSAIINFFNKMVAAPPTLGDPRRMPAE